MKAATNDVFKERQVRYISIHAAREGGDYSDGVAVGAALISIHAAREGGDGIHSCGDLGMSLFQSTPPVKAATFQICSLITMFLRFQSTPPVKAATQNIIVCKYILIFQSTPPVKAATTSADDGLSITGISIHAAREGGDKTQCGYFKSRAYFNPRRP